MPHNLRHPARGRAGLTLIELLIVLVVMGIAGVLLTPALRGYLDHLTVEAGLNRISSDIYYTRMLAVRTGYPAELHFRPDGSGCDVGSYSIVSLAPGAGVVRHSELDLRPTDCLNAGSRTLRFEPRGLLAPFHNRTVTLRSGGSVQAIRISVLGYVRRIGS